MESHIMPAVAWAPKPVEKAPAHCLGLSGLRCWGARGDRAGPQPVNGLAPYGVPPPA
jgi:hypothetical protein